MSRGRKLANAVRQTLTGLKTAKRGIAAGESDLEKYLNAQKAKNLKKRQKLLDMNKGSTSKRHYSQSAQCRKGFHNGRLTKAAIKHGLHVCEPNKQTRMKNRKLRKPSDNALKRYTSGKCENKQVDGKLFKYKCNRQSKYAKSKKMTVCCRRKPRSASKATKQKRKAQKLKKNRRKSTKKKKNTKKKQAPRRMSGRNRQKRKTTL